MERFLDGVERGTRACDEFPTARISHVRYADLLDDPIAATRRAYAELDVEFSPEAEARMREFLARPQKDKHQNHYRAEVYGLDPADLRARFAPYMQRFGVEADRSRRVSPAVPAALLEGERLPGA